MTSWQQEIRWTAIRHAMLREIERFNEAGGATYMVLTSATKNQWKPRRSLSRMRQFEEFASGDSRAIGDMIGSLLSVVEMTVPDPRVKRLVLNEHGKAVLAKWNEAPTSS